LKVPETADADTIRLAYRRLLREWHPDRNTDSQAAHVTQRLNAAYRVLCNERERRAYDQRLAGDRARSIATPAVAAGRRLRIRRPQVVGIHETPKFRRSGGLVPNGVQPKMAWRFVLAALQRLRSRVRF